MVETTIEDFVARTGAHHDFNPDGPDGIRRDWHSVRYFVAFEDHALEQIAVHASLANSGPSLDHDVATRLAHAAGGTLFGSARGAQLVMPVVRSTTLAVHEMRTTISADDYIRQFIDGRP